MCHDARRGHLRRELHPDWIGLVAVSIERTANALLSTDYAYTWVDGKVKLSDGGQQWETLAELDKRVRADGPLVRQQLRDEEVRDMSALRMDSRGVMAKSGLVILRG